MTDPQLTPALRSMNIWINRFAILAIIFGVWAMAYDTGLSHAVNICSYPVPSSNR